MEDLIKQAFLHVDVIGPHVQAGHYDLIGPNGEIILPQVWDKVVEPDWQITMQMWPMDRPGPIGRPGMPTGPLPAGMAGRMPLQGGARPGGRPAGPPPPPSHHPGMGRPPHMGGGGQMPPRVVTVDKPRKPAKNSGVLSWMVGKPPKRK